ncbi:AraC family transcriptional regulator [Enterococcus sp. PF1-24]|uniref:GyrI-like domain-containing protein n=1 Tax=unclassified Enterococcus TaxID=2608891 RepID=UPI0024730C1D|nr:MULTISPECIES: effector binding domain-containing protein [unclassified Enterococcus]MDH6364671.1 AraC family transcriptional regulator [Enterococcus sp. PFB1-1]MDH6401772.1 AraC family transcriptional regulator [Enterococcus sp. PF1-24]
MEYRIESLGEFKIVGYKISSTNAMFKGMRDCPAFWKKIIKEKKNEILVPFITQEPLGLMGVSVYNVDSQDNKKFDYYIAASTTLETPTELEEYLVPAMTWAVFPCTRKTSGKTQMNIVNKWEPQADYQLLNTGYKSGKMISAAPDMEVYGKDDEVGIWVPVKKK